MYRSNVIYISTHPGYSRAKNQDNFFFNGEYKRDTYTDVTTFCKETCDDDYALLAVFDGMGGLSAGEVAALIACEVTEEHYRSQTCDIGNIIEEANERICRKSKEDRIKLGSTCVFVEKQCDRYRSWNIGDSRSYVKTKDGMRQLSVNHTEAETQKMFAVATGQATGIGELSQHVLTQHLGIPKSEFVIEPYVSEWVELEENGLIMLCSDGLTDMVSDDEIEAVMLSDKTVCEKGEALKKKALENGGTDNITIVLLGTAANK